MNKKETFLRQLNEAFARSNISYLLDNVTDDIRWNIVGDRSIEGKVAFKNALEDMASDEPFDLSIKTLVTQGNTSVVEGLISSPDGRTYAFCDIYTFKEAQSLKIRMMTSYVITLNQ